jgi:hypothetical protein
MTKLLAATLALLCAVASAQTPPPTQRLRGVVQSFDGTTLVVNERNGTVVSLVLADNFSVNEVVPIEPTAIAPGSFIGTAPLPGADGSLSALEAGVPGSGARHRRRPGRGTCGRSTMTNATVAQVVATPQGRSMTLKYKDGEKTVVVPDGVPIVTRPATGPCSWPAPR